MTVNQDGVGERSEAEWKPEKENCTVYSFPGVAACGESNCGSQREQMMKVVCFFVCFGDMYSLTVNQDGACERAEIIQSLSQLRWQLSLPKRADFAISLGCWFIEEKQFK